MLKQTRASELRDYAKSLGWEVIAKKTDEVRTLVCARGNRFKLRVAWDGTKLQLPMMYKEFGPSGQLVDSGQVPTMKQFRDLLELHASGEKTDAEILDFYRGKTIWWRNHLSNEIQNAFVSPYGKHYYVRASRDERKYIQFCDGEGFHAVYIDAIVRTKKGS